MCSNRFLRFLLFDIWLMTVHMLVVGLLVYPMYNVNWVIYYGGLMYSGCCCVVGSTSAVAL